MKELDTVEAAEELNALLKAESWQKVEQKLSKIVVDHMAKNETLEILNIKITKNNNNRFVIKLQGE